MCSGKWGDEFEARIPSWLPMPSGCSCNSIKAKMNNCQEHIARELFDQFAEAILKNAISLPLLKPLGHKTIDKTIRRRMAAAFKAAYGSEQ